MKKVNSSPSRVAGYAGFPQHDKLFKSGYNSFKHSINPEGVEQLL